MSTRERDSIVESVESVEERGRACTLIDAKGCAIACTRPRKRARACVCVREPGHGWVGRSGGLGSIGHSYGNVSNYRTEPLARPEDPRVR